MCRICGEEQDFPNYTVGNSWGSDVSIEQLAGASGLSTSADLMKVGREGRLDDEA